MDEEKRRYLRWKEKIRVTYACGEQDEHYQETFTEDLSEGGMQILGYEKLKADQEVKLRLEFVSDSVPIAVESRVVSVKACGSQYRVGLKFTQIDEFDRHRLRRNLEKANLDFRNEAG